MITINAHHVLAPVRQTTVRALAVLSSVSLISDLHLLGYRFEYRRGLANVYVCRTEWEASQCCIVLRNLLPPYLG
jgi:hypothetical protein